MYKNNPGLFKTSIRKEAIKIMEKIQYYFKPAHDFLSVYEKKYARPIIVESKVEENLLEK